MASLSLLPRWACHSHNIAMLDICKGAAEVAGNRIMPGVHFASMAVKVNVVSHESL